jgi:hypothetical protein
MKCILYTAAALSLLLGGCDPKAPGGDTDTGEPNRNDTGEPTLIVPPTTLTSAGYACSGDQWVLSAETEGWTSTGRFNLWETGNDIGWDEEHPLPSVDFDPDQQWDLLESVLTSSASVADFVAGTNTVFQCGVHDIDPVMTWMVRVTDPTGVDADCWLAGSDPDGPALVQGGGGPANNTVSNPEDIASCTVYTR